MRGADSNIRAFRDYQIVWRKKLSDSVNKNMRRRRIPRLKILVEFSRQQALSDTTKMAQWNRAVDIVDNGWRIKSLK